MSAKRSRSAAYVDNVWWRLLTSCDELCFGLLLPGFSDEPRSDPQLRRIRLSLWRLRRAFQRLGGPEAQRAISELLRLVVPQLEQSRSDIFVWLDFVEQLVQGAESSLGTKPGMGERKAALVKGALLYWIRKQRVDIPGIPAFLEPFVAELVLDLIISSIVQVANRQALWQPDTPALPVAPRRAAFFGWVARLLRRLTSWLDNRAWSFVMRQYPVETHIKAAIDSLGPEAEQILSRTLRGSLQFLRWVIEHRKVFTDALDLVVLAVNETEGFLEMSGPEKRVYARRYILEFLIEEGVVARDGLIRLLVERFLDISVDAVVHVIQRRDGFQRASNLALGAAK